YSHEASTPNFHVGWKYLTAQKTLFRSFFLDENLAKQSHEYL
ncbi:MAG: hypothetical protein ACI8Q1_003855, partial [Parvicella sp.]